MPLAAVPSSALAANLACLGERNADVRQALAGTPPRDDVVFADTPQGVPSVSAGDVPLCSRHRPLDEAEQLAREVDLVENAVVVALGFGAGYHVQRVAERLGRGGVVVVFEPDLGLLRAVLERIDHSAWLSKALVVFVTDPEDRGALAGKLQDGEAIIAQGVAFLEHPASRGRLGRSCARFMRLFREHVDAAKTVFLTTLMRSVDTIRNLLLNLDHYAAGAGVSDLEGAAAGFPAVVVSAGPSLCKNIHLLAAPMLRRRCVLVAAQTTLRPMLAAGARPHFVTALDYHEISRRFYEGLDAGSVGDATLIADPKANPVILDAFPGPVRCCANPFLDELLGDRKRPMGTLPAGSTVAHLAVYTARYLGCDPIILIGQDLAFSDALYYTPGTAIDEVWAPELNPFNTIEMMQWQRIARHKRHLRAERDVHGRPVYTDLQMSTYLRQFERDFARYEADGVRVIDATEGGLRKQHTTAMPLAEALRAHAVRDLPPIPPADRRLDPKRLEAARERLDAVRRDVAAMADLSRQTEAVLRDMVRDRDEPAKMNAHFAKLERYRRQADERRAALDILNHLNQLGAFKRLRADRRLSMQAGLDAYARQGAQLDRDLTSVAWIGDAAREMLAQLDDARERLREERLREPFSRCAGPRIAPQEASAAKKAPGAFPPPGKKAPGAVLAALVPVDPQRNALGVARSLAAPFAGRPVLQATLERLARCASIESIILLAPRGFDVDALLDRNRIPLPVEIERCDGSPFGPEAPAIAAARRWADTSWRGGVAGMSVYDEVLCPAGMSAIMERRGLTGAILAAPDWPLLDVSEQTGAGAVVARHLELPAHHSLVFTQAPPGLGACLVSAALMKELAGRNRLSTIGGLLVYQPHAPQHDPIARTANVQIDHRVSRSRIRATFDAPRYRRILAGALHALGELEAAGAAAVVEAIERAQDSAAETLPRHVVLELTTARGSRGMLASGPVRPALPVALAISLFEQLAGAGDAVVTLAGAGDPLLHDRFDEIVESALSAGILGVHVRTELLCDRPVLERLVACRPDVVSVDLHADSPETYRRLMGTDEFGRVVANITELASLREPLTAHAGPAALAVPWIVPRMRRCPETLGEIERFFDRWQGRLGAAVIEGAPPDAPADLLPAPAPSRVLADIARRTMTILCDGSIPAPGGGCASTIAEAPLPALWSALRKSSQAGFP